MIPAPLSIWTAGLSGIIAVLLCSLWIILSNLSRGFIRKLDDKNPELAKQLEEIKELGDELRIRLHVLFAADIILLLLSVYSIGHNDATVNTPWYTPAIAVAVCAVVYLTVAEWLGAHSGGMKSAKLLARSAGPTIFASNILFPVTLPLIFWHRRMVFWEQMHSEEEEQATAEDEIMSLIEKEEEGEGDSALEEDERRMIRGVFDLDETLVREIITPRVDLDAVEDTSSIGEIKEKIITSGHSRIPVFHESIDHIVGVLYAKDLLDDTRLASIKSLGELYHNPAFIPETKNIGDLLEEFQQTQIHFAVVLDEYGGTSGVVTFEDILEEIVGDIRDEYDIDEADPSKLNRLDDGSVVADARMPIDEFNEAFEVELPEDEDFDTIAGYIVSLSGSIPQAGETVESPLVRFHIQKADQRRILKVKAVRKTPVAEESENE